MLISGTKHTRLGQFEATGMDCETCGGGPIILDMYSKHAHIYWIPFFPMGNEGQSFCSACEEIRTPEEMPQPLLDRYNQGRHKLSAPLWKWSGVFAVAAFLFVVSLLGALPESPHTADADTMSYAASPQAGDLVYLHSGDDYTVGKIEAVDDDGVAYLRHSDYVANYKSGMDELLARGFGDTLKPTTSAILGQKIADGEVYKIERL